MACEYTLDIKSADLLSFLTAVDELTSALKARKWSKVSIWGAGKNGRMLYSLLASTDIAVDAIYDDHSTGMLGQTPITNSSHAERIPTDIPILISINPHTCPSIKDITSRLDGIGVPYACLDIHSTSERANTQKGSNRSTAAIKRMSTQAALSNLKDNGFLPSTVLDVGAASGSWSVQCSSIFPDARYLMIEPLEDEYAALHSKVRLKDYEFVFCAASDSNSEQVFNVHPDWTSSSLFKEFEGPSVDGVERRIECRTLDSIVDLSRNTGPFLVKIDTQGNELKVLEGAKALLPSTEVVVLEVSLYPFFNGGPLVHDVIAYMKEAGFILHDILTAHYKLLDGTMSQSDFLFVREDSQLHANTAFATPEQRKEKVASFEHSHKAWAS